MKKYGVLIAILLSVVSIGLETVAKILSIATHNVGYILGILSFLGAVVIGVRNNTR